MAARPLPVARYVVGVLLLAAFYYGAGRASLALQYTGPVAAIWLPAGVGAATLYLAGLPWFPGVIVGDLALADTSQPLGSMLGITAGNVADIVVIAVLLRRLLGPRAALDRLPQVGGMLVAIAAGAAITATVATLSSLAGDIIASSDVPAFWRSWSLADASGSLIVIPLALAWARPPSRAWRGRGLWEGAIMIGAVVALSAIALSGDLLLTYLVFPALIWAVLRFGLQGGTLAVAVAAGIAVGITASDAGPFVQHSITEATLGTQLYIAVAALTTLCLAAIVAERRRASAEVLRLAEEQAALRRVATLVAREASPSELFAAVGEEVGRVLRADVTNVLRYDAEDAGTIVAGWSRRGGHIPVATSLTLEGDSVAALVLQSATAARMDTYADAPGPLASRLRDLGVRSAVGAPIVADDRLWGVVIAAMTRARPLPDDSETRLTEFTELVATAIANAHSRQELAASRARVVAAADQERRRLERNLHDGAQQRLVSLGLRLRAAATAVPAELDELTDSLSQTASGLNDVLDELREIARGLHPPILSTAGLRPALAALARRSAVPVQLSVTVTARLPEHVEVATYFVASEALANAAKHARAALVRIALAEHDGCTELTIADDGIGGADPKGTGLIGLRDRVEAVGGTFHVASPTGEGTTLVARLPTQPD
jgi:signal transduction histidine kinase